MNQVSDGERVKGAAQAPSDRFWYFASSFLKRFMLVSFPVVLLVVLGLNLLIIRYNGSFDVVTFVPYLISETLSLYLALVITLGLPVSAIVGLVNRVPRDPVDVQPIAKRPEWIQFCTGVGITLVAYIVPVLVGGDGLGVLFLQIFMAGIWFISLVILLFMRAFWIAMGMAVTMLALYLLL